MVNKKTLHPIDKEILRALMVSRIRVTPSQVSRAIGVHPVTAQNRINELRKEGLIKCTPKGNRLYCKVNRNSVKRRLELDRKFRANRFGLLR